MTRSPSGELAPTEKGLKVVSLRSGSQDGKRRGYWDSCFSHQQAESWGGFLLIVTCPRVHREYIQNQRDRNNNNAVMPPARCHMGTNTALATFLVELGSLSFPFSLLAPFSLLSLHFPFSTPLSGLSLHVKKTDIIQPCIIFYFCLLYILHLTHYAGR